MREAIVSHLIQLLNNNVGNRLSPELGTGIAALMNQFIEQLENSEPKAPTLE